MCLRTVEIENNTISYELVRMNRKSVTINISQEGKVIVKAPILLAARKVDTMVLDKVDWILENQSKILTAFQRKPDYVDGEEVWYLGKPYVLRICQGGQKNVVTRLGNTIFMKGSGENKEERRKAMELWLRAEAKQVFAERVREYQDMIGAYPQKICIKDQKTRWGSCSQKKNLNFNFRLMLMPIEIVDYVVVHELCHLIHMDHSKEFWNLVGAVLPDYKIRRNELKEHGKEWSML